MIERQIKIETATGETFTLGPKQEIRGLFSRFAPLGMHSARSYQVGGYIASEAVSEEDDEIHLSRVRSVSELLHDPGISPREESCANGK